MRASRNYYFQRVTGDSMSEQTLADSTSVEKAIEARIRESIRDLRRRGLNQDLQRHAYWVDGRELTPVQVDTLQTLVRKPVWRIKDLAEAIGVDPSQSSRIIAGLTQMGLAASSKSSDDRRSADVSATPSGRHWADEITKRLDMLSGMVIQRLPPDHRYMLAELLEEYLEAMAEVRDQLKREAKIPAG